MTSLQSGTQSAEPVTNQSALISVIVLTFNEETNLPECLASLTGLDCSVFVVDSGSTDRTMEIASASGVSMWSHCFTNYAAQRNWAQENLPLATDWILHLDADERLTPDLVQEINDSVRAGTPASGFLLRKRTIFLGKWIRHGGHYPSYHLRLFRRGSGRCEERLYDQHFLVDGQVAKLKHDYVDVVASSLETWTLRHVRWAKAEARELDSQAAPRRQVSANLLGNAIQRRRWLRLYGYERFPLFFRSFFYFLYRYFLRLGFLDGTRGLVFHFLQGCWFRFLVDCFVYTDGRTYPLRK
jgi:glycosyltransferase involved in cell wall biosynthesis